MRENGERRWIQEGEWDGREEGWVVTHPCVIVCGTRMERERERGHGRDSVVSSMSPYMECLL